MVHVKREGCFWSGELVELQQSTWSLRNRRAAQLSPIYTNQPCCGFFNAPFSFFPRHFFILNSLANLFTDVCDGGFITDSKYE